MRRLSRKQIYEMALDAGSLNSPVLKRYFKRVYVGCGLKERIERSRSKFKG